MDSIYGEFSAAAIFTYSTNEAGVMPGVPKGFQKFVSSLDGELTAMAASPKQTVEVFSEAKRDDMHPSNQLGSKS